MEVTMKRSSIKLFSLVLALILAFSLVSISAGAETDLGKVRVIVKNETFSAESGANWTGVLVEKEIQLGEDSTMTTVVKDALDSENVSYSFNSYNYLATVNGLSEYAANGSGGWMMTLNDWFTSEGSDSYTVSNGSLGDGDVITVMYTCSWGADVGSLWGNTDTKLKSIKLDGAAFSNAEEFSSAKTDWTIILDPENESTEVGIIPEAANKNYQVKAYLNEYTPGQPGTELKVLSKKLDVKKGDIIYIGVGNENWATMNQKADETVYKLTVEYAFPTGDVNRDGVVNINDVTLLQKHIARAAGLNAYQKKLADCNSDDRLTISDATAIQKIIAKFS